MQSIQLSRLIGAVNDARERCLRPRSGSRDDRGFILVAVIAVLGLLGLIAFLLNKSVSLDVKLASYSARRAEAESVADGIARLAIRHLVVNTPVEGRSGQLRLDGTPTSCRIGRHVATLTLTDSDGLINLNLAAPELIERLIAGISTSKAEAAELARAIVDFRSEGDTSIGGGSKRAAYELAGLGHGPKMAYFESAIELDQVVGMTADLVKRLKPLVTVNSRYGTVNMKVASAGVIMALAGEVGAGPLVDFSAAEQLRTTLNLPPSFTIVPRSRSTQTTSSKSVVVRAYVHHANGGGFARESIVGLALTSQSAATVVGWSEILEAPPPALSGIDALPACVGGVLSLDQP